MSAALSLPQPCYASHNTTTLRTIAPISAAPLWLFLGTVLAIGVTFFVATHDTHVSLAVAYTQNAEEMELATAGGNTLRRISFLKFGACGAALLIAGKKRFRIDPLVAG